MEQFLIWALRREPTMNPEESNFWAYEDSYKKAELMLNGIQGWVNPEVYKYLIFNLTLHYIITFDYEFSLDGEIIKNPLYAKYSISDKQGGIVSSASDESSSASYHITASVNNADFLTQDLMMTPYGTWVYSVLEQLNIMPVRL